MIETCLSNVQEGRKSRNIKGKAVTTALNALQPPFWPHLCEENLRTTLPWLLQLTGN